MTSKATRNATSLPVEGSGQLPLGLPDGQMTNTSGPARARASRSAKSGKAVALMMKGICGPTFTDSLRPEGPMSSWENRLRVRLGMVGSTESAMIWEQKTTPAGKSIFRLRPWTPPTSGNGSIGLRSPSPRKSDGNGPGKHGDGGIDLRTAMATAYMPTPWVTPSSRDWKDSPGMTAERKDGRSRIDQLPRQMAATWRTPIALTGRGGDSYTPEQVQHRVANGNSISVQEQMCATAASGQITNGSSATTEKRGAPNPVFACWLMGFPDEWVSGALRAMQSMPNSRRKSSGRSSTPVAETKKPG